MPTQSLKPTTGLPKSVSPDIAKDMGEEVKKIQDEALNQYKKSETIRAAWSVKIAEAIYNTVDKQRLDEDISWSVDTSLECNVLANRLNKELGPWVMEQSDLTWIHMTTAELTQLKTMRDFLRRVYKHLV